MNNNNKANPIKPKQAKDIQHWHIETDIAVIGFGGAGACAALEAARAGSQVSLFELSSASGGSTALSSAEIYMGGNGGTRVQQACGFNDESEDMYNYLMAAAGEHADSAKIRAYVDGSQAHFDWLLAQGVEYKDSFHQERAIMCLSDDCLLYTGSEKAWPFKDLAKPCPRGHNLKVEGDNGGPLLMKLLTEQVEQNSNIDIHYEARALTLVVNEEQAVCGVIIRINQAEVAVKTTQGVILTAGGFVMNDAMLEKYAPKLLNSTEKIGNPGDTGSGILMGMGVGGAAINMHEGFVSLPFYPPAKLTEAILINSQGQRFINEDCYHGRVGYYLHQQLGDRIYMIVSANDDFEPPMFLCADICATGETIEELAAELELDSDQLAHTIDFYNKHAKQEQDPLFHKSVEYLSELKPPYAALDCTPGRGAFFPYFTLGGLDSLPSGEVLDQDRHPIKGLYAAGRTTAGVPRTGAGYSSGMSVGDATFFGRLAGQACAKN